MFISDRNGSENVWIAKADGSQARALSKGEGINYVSPTWTPDGQYAMVTRGGQLWLYHRDGGSGVQMTGVRPASATGPVAPLAATAHDHDAPRSSARRIGTYQIGLLDRVVGRTAVRTSESEGAFRPMPSPDGKWLVYAQS